MVGIRGYLTDFIDVWFVHFGQEMAENITEYRKNEIGLVPPVTNFFRFKQSAMTLTLKSSYGFQFRLSKVFFSSKNLNFYFFQAGYI